MAAASIANIRFFEAEAVEDNCARAWKSSVMDGNPVGKAYVSENPKPTTQQLNQDVPVFYYVVSGILLCSCAPKKLSFTCHCPWTVLPSSFDNYMKSADYFAVNVCWKAVFHE